jgi:hypothetical protein
MLTSAGTVVQFQSLHLVEASQALELVEVVVVVVVVAAGTVIEVVSLVQRRFLQYQYL